jgi:hypothetical protein
MNLLVRIVKDVMNMVDMTLPKPNQERRVAFVALLVGVGILFCMAAVATLLVRSVVR